MEALCVIGWMVGYMMVAGVVVFLMNLRWPRTQYGLEEIAHGTVAAFWPFAGPAVLAYLLAKRVADGLADRRAVAKAEADELRKRVAELDEELRASKSPSAT